MDNILVMTVARIIRSASRVRLSIARLSLAADFWGLKEESGQKSSQPSEAFALSHSGQLIFHRSTG